MGKQAKRLSAVTARLQTVPAFVASPYTPGTVDRVDRVLDPVLAMRRAGKITQEQFDAAESYRTAYDAVRAGARSVDLARIGGSGFGSKTPAPAQFDAALRLREATRALGAVPVPAGGQVDVTVVVEMVAGQGWTIDGAASAIHGVGASGRASGRNRALVATIFRAGLDALVDLWIRPSVRRVYRYSPATR